MLPARRPYSSNGSNVNGGPLPVVVGDCAGQQVARLPEWSATLDYTHVFRLGGGGDITFDGSVKYSSGRWLSIDFIPSERDGSYAVVDAALTYHAPDDRWSAGLSPAT